MFFCSYILCSYNKLIGSQLLIDCPCYELYRNEERFIEEVINKRQSYMGCLAYESQTRKRIAHRSIIIMLGSYVDFRIRGAEAVMRSQSLWCTVIVKGMSKFYTSFSTFDALSMHVRQTGVKKSIEWYTYVGKDGLAIKYRNKTIEWTFHQKTRNNYNSNEWITLLNEANPFIKRNISHTEYITMFDTLLQYPYNMNDLKNRQFLNPATIIQKYINSDINKRKKNNGAGCQKLSTAFVSGSFFVVLSKNNSYETLSWSKNYTQTYDNTLHEGRSNKVCHFLCNVTRASNDAVRNSAALTFPQDAWGYFCPLNTKDLKSAGEQNVLADYVIMSEESDQMELYRYLVKITQSYKQHMSETKENEDGPRSNSAATTNRKNDETEEKEEKEEEDDDDDDDDEDDDFFSYMSLGNVSFKRKRTQPSSFNKKRCRISRQQQQHLKHDTREEKHHANSDSSTAATAALSTMFDSNEKTDVFYFIINGFICDCYAKWSFKLFLQIKQKFPHVTTKYYPPYVIFSTKPSIPLKYSDKYDVFFSSAETTRYNIVYPEMSFLSYTAKQLSVIGIRKTQPAKSTVAINNIKGSVANVTSNLHRDLMKMSLGITCYINMTPELVKSIQECAVLAPKGSLDTTNFHNYMQLANKDFKLSEQMDMIRGEKRPIDTDTSKAMNALINKLYSFDELRVEYRNAMSTPYIRKRNDQQSLIKSYKSLVFSKEAFETPPVWNFKLWAAFGNIKGYCVEDGVILDSKTVAAMPSIIYNACITVEFTFKTLSQPENAIFVYVNEMQKNKERMQEIYKQSHIQRDEGDDDDEFDDLNEETLIGCLISEHEVHIKNSKHCKIMLGKIGNHLYYLLHFLPKQHNTYTDLRVRHTIEDKVITVIITGVHEARIGIGTKVSNSFGQKNVCSHVTDLSNYRGVTRDGRCVYPQILYSDISLIGRIASGQIYCALTSDDLAIGPNGEILALIDVVIHTIHPYSNVRVFVVKADTLTNINGFDSQSLNTMNLALRTEPISKTCMQVIGLHGYNIKFVNDQDHLNDKRALV